jgi:tRNA 2-selenouridine synthase
LHGHEVTDRWCDLARQGEWAVLVGELLAQHYDPAYKRSSGMGFRPVDQAKVLKLDALDSASLGKVAADLIQNER